MLVIQVKSYLKLATIFYIMLLSPLPFFHWHLNTEKLRSFHSKGAVFSLIPFSSGCAKKMMGTNSEPCWKLLIISVHKYFPVNIVLIFPFFLGTLSSIAVDSAGLLWHSTFHINLHEEQSTYFSHITLSLPLHHSNLEQLLYIFFCKPKFSFNISYLLHIYVRNKKQ